MTESLKKIDTSLVPVQNQAIEVHHNLPFQQRTTNVDKEEHKPIDGQQAQML